VRLVDLFERLRPVFGDFDLIAAAAQTAKKQITILRVIVDNQQFTGTRCHKPSLERTLLCTTVGFFSAKLGES